MVMVAQVPGGAGPVRVTGRVGAGRFEQVVTPQVVEQGRAIEIAWAHAHILALTERGGDPRALASAIAAVSVEHQVPSPYTERVAVAVPGAADGASLLARPAPRSPSFLPIGRTIHDTRPLAPGRVSPFSPRLDPGAFPADPLTQIPTPLLTPEPQAGFRGPLLVDRDGVFEDGSNEGARVDLTPRWALGPGDDVGVLDARGALWFPFDAGYGRIGGVFEGSRVARDG